MGDRPVLFAVTRAAGPRRDPARARRDQDGWDERAAFTEGLVAEGFVVLGEVAAP